MKRKRKGWLLIVTLLVVAMLLSGCGESVTTEESKVQESNTQVVQEETKPSRFMLVEEGKIGKSPYTIYVDTTTRVMWLKTIHTYIDGTGNGVGLAFEPMIDSEGNPLLYEGELTTQK